MAKIKLTKGELKRQRDGLKQFRRYLPTLQLKKQQLQIRISQTRRTLSEKIEEINNIEKTISTWIGLLADPGINIRKWVLPKEVNASITNIAGASIPVFKNIVFEDADYDFFVMPFWVDQGIIELKNYITLLSKIRIIEKQIVILGKELRVTTQRVNLFEKIKIPTCIENIRVIRIYLGDQQANAVGISKVAKRKIETAQESVLV